MLLVDSVENEDEIPKQTELGAHERVDANSNMARAPRKPKENVTEVVDAAVTARLTAAANAEAAEKQFASVLERYDECTKTVCPLRRFFFSWHRTLCTERQVLWQVQCSFPVCDKPKVVSDSPAWRSHLSLYVVPVLVGGGQMAAQEYGAYRRRVCALHHERLWQGVC